MLGGLMSKESLVMGGVGIVLLGSIMGEAEYKSSKKKKKEKKLSKNEEKEFEVNEVNDIISEFSDSLSKQLSQVNELVDSMKSSVTNSDSTQPQSQAAPNTNNQPDQGIPYYYLDQNGQPVYFYAQSAPIPVAAQ